MDIDARVADRENVTAYRVTETRFVQTDTGTEAPAVMLSGLATSYILAFSSETPGLRLLSVAPGCQRTDCWSLLM
jgi:hypothetical protein